MRLDSILIDFGKNVSNKVSIFSLPDIRNMIILLYRTHVRLAKWGDIRWLNVIFIRFIGC